MSNQRKKAILLRRVNTAASNSTGTTAKTRVSTQFKLEVSDIWAHPWPNHGSIDFLENWKNSNKSRRITRWEKARSARTGRSRVRYRYLGRLAPADLQPPLVIPDRRKLIRFIRHIQSRVTARREAVVFAWRSLWCCWMGWLFPADTP